jgi:pyridoxamine 5'-phosphate oxidase
MDRDADLLRDRRSQYETAGIDVDDVAPDPVDQWHRWHREAFAAGVAEPNAMVVATVDATGAPSARTVLVRGVDARGLTFFTNYESPKSRQLDASPHVAAVFLWADLHRQIRVFGRAERISAVESDEYFAGRPRGSQIGAWASPQSTVIADRRALDELVARASARFADAAEVSRPPFWGGWRIVPDEFEFWQGRPDRLHDRLRYRPDAGSGAWRIDRLAP